MIDTGNMAPLSLSGGALTFQVQCHNRHFCALLPSESNAVSDGLNLHKCTLSFMLTI